MGEFSTYIEELSGELEQRCICDINITPKVSVIVPVYNLEDLISETLMSLINQTFKDFEIIVLNDGSKDNSLSIISVFAQFDKRIKIVNQENQGLGATRNNALCFAKGEYILYLDGDDLLSNDAIEILVESMKKDDFDFVVLGAYNYHSSKKSVGSYSYQKLPKFLRNKILENNDEILSNLFRFPRTAWSKFYRKDFVVKNGLKFQEKVTGEDQLFFVNAFINANKIMVLEKNLYYYRRARKNSLTFSKVRNTTDLIKIFYAVEEIVSTYNKINSEFIIKKYLQKAIVGLSKCSKEYRVFYYAEMLKMFHFVSDKYPNLELNKLKINQNDSYLSLKLKLYFINLCWR